MSRPRAAMSVATSTGRLPSLKRDSARVRAPWLLLPWMAIASMPSLPSCSARRLAPCLVLVKTSTCVQRREPIRYDSSARLRVLGTRWALCATSSDAVLRGATSTSAGLSSRPCASERISGEKVAENSRFWRLAGSLAMTRRISWMKPMSSMRSASSSTKISTPDRSTVPCCTWSSSRPGVATRMSTGWRSAWICGLMLTPPKISTERMRVYLA